MHVRRPLVATVLAPLLLGLALSGCQEAEPTPKMPETTASSATPTETPTAEQESPEDFIRRWVAAGDEMQVTGETAEYLAMSPNCKDCKEFAERVARVYEAGGHAEFAGSTVTKIKRVAAKPPTFELHKDVPETVIHHAGGRVQRLDAGEAVLTVALGREAGELIVNYFGAL